MSATGSEEAVHLGHLLENTLSSLQSSSDSTDSEDAADSSEATRQFLKSSPLLEQLSSDCDKFSMSSSEDWTYFTQFADHLGGTPSADIRIDTQMGKILCIAARRLSKVKSIDANILQTFSIIIRKKSIDLSEDDEWLREVSNFIVNSLRTKNISRDLPWLANVIRLSEVLTTNFGSFEWTIFADIEDAIKLIISFVLVELRVSLPLKDEANEIEKRLIHNCLDAANSVIREFELAEVDDLSDDRLSPILKLDDQLITHLFKEMSNCLGEHLSQLITLLLDPEEEVRYDTRLQDHIMSTHLRWLTFHYSNKVREHSQKVDLYHYRLVSGASCERESLGVLEKDLLDTLANFRPVLLRLISRGGSRVFQPISSFARMFPDQLAQFVGQLLTECRDAWLTKAPTNVGLLDLLQVTNSDLKFPASVLKLPRVQRDQVLFAKVLIRVILTSEQISPQLKRLISSAQQIQEEQEQSLSEVHNRHLVELQAIVSRKKLNI